MIRYLVAQLAGSLLILGLAGWFIVDTVPSAKAASCAGTWQIASYYGAESGSRTANGEHFDGTGLTAASLTLPFGTRLRVTFGGKAVVVRINDRGPYVKGRALDLSRAAAARIGMIPAGVGRVCVERL